MHYISRQGNIFINIGNCKYFNKNLRDNSCSPAPSKLLGNTTCECTLLCRFLRDTPIKCILKLNPTIIFQTSQRNLIKFLNKWIMIMLMFKAHLLISRLLRSTLFRSFLGDSAIEFFIQILRLVFRQFVG